MPANATPDGSGAPIAAAAEKIPLQLVITDSNSLSETHGAELANAEATPADNAPEAAQSSIPSVTLDEILDAAGELAALPHVVLRLIQMTSDPTITAGDLERVILTDQAVAARVLALANSAYFSLPRRVYFVREAVVFLGFKSVRNLAMTVTAVNMFLGRSDEQSIARAHLWHHSLDVAMVSRTIAEYLHKSYRADVNSEEAFTAGLLHDIGKMVLDLALPERYLLTIKLVNERGMRFIDVEDKLFPFSHAAVGAGLAQRWNLPQVLNDAIAYHHSPAEAEANKNVVAIVALADELTGYLSSISDSPDEIVEAAPALYTPACALLAIEASELPKLILNCQAELEKGLTLHGCV